MIGYGWIDSLKSIAEAKVSSQDLKDAATRFPHDPPSTKEAYYYRCIFHELFPKDVVRQNYTPERGSPPKKRLLFCSYPDTDHY